MTSSFTPSLSLELPANNDYINTWDVPVNGDFTIVDQAIGGSTTLNVVAVSGTVTLTATQYRSRVFTLSGLLTANVTYQFPTGVGGFWFMRNATSGAFSVTIASAGGGTNLVLTQGATTALTSDGTNIRRSDTNTAAAGGSPTQIQFNSSGILTGSSSLTWNGSALSAPVFVGSLTGTATSVSSSVTFNNSNAGAASGSTFNGASAITISRNTLGAAGLGANTDITALNATGGISIGAATGGAQGTGTVNATGFYVNGVAVSGGGGVSTVSVVSANGFAGSVANPTTTPAITVTTSVTGVLKGNGTAISAATSGTDYVAPSAYASANGLTISSGRLLGRTTASTGAAEEISVAGSLSLSGGVLTGTGGTVTSVSGTGTVNGLTLSGTVTTSGNLTLGGTLNLSSPPAIGGTSPAAVSATALSATSIANASVLATNSGLTSATAIAVTTTYTTAGITLPSQTLAAGSVWRIRAYGDYTSVNNATTRSAQIAAFWDTISLTSYTTFVTINTARVIPWNLEIEISAINTTDAWVTGTFLNNIATASLQITSIMPTLNTPLSTGPQTLDLRFSMSTAAAGDSWNIYQVTMERLK